MRDQIVDELRRDPKFWMANVNVYDPQGTVYLTKDRTKASFDDYVNHLARPNTFGDTGCLFVCAFLYPNFEWKIFDTFSVPEGYASLSQCSERLTDAVDNDQPWALPLGTEQKNVLHLFYDKFHYDFIQCDLEEADFDMIEGSYGEIAGTLRYLNLCVVYDLTLVV